MNRRTRRVFKGFQALDRAEREELLAAMKEHMDKPKLQQVTIEEEIKADLGPLTQDVCPCCGR